MSTSPDDERQENSLCENVCESLKVNNSIEECKAAYLSASTDGQCGKLNNLLCKESTVGIQNDNQDKTVSNDSKVNGEKNGNNVQINTEKEQYLTVSTSVNNADIPVRVLLTTDELSLISKDDLVEYWLKQNKYILHLLSKLESNNIEEVKVLQEREEKYKLQLSELQKKEQYHAMRLTTKEHELQELGIQTEELKACMGGTSLKYCMLDPATNLLYERMKRDFDLTKAKMEETQNELSAWKFTPDSNTGKQLMAKCRLLIKENEELGKMICSGRLSKLEGDLGLQRNFSDEFKKSQSEVDEFLQEMDEDTEGMQGTILFLQSQLRQAKERISRLSDQLACALILDPGAAGTATRTTPLPPPVEDEEEEQHSGGFPNGDGEEIGSPTVDKDDPTGDLATEEIKDATRKRTHSAMDDQPPDAAADLCVPYKKERTKSPPLFENGL